MNQGHTTRPALSTLATNKLIRNTCILLSLTLLFGALMASVSIALNLPSMGLLITLTGVLGLLFLTDTLRNSAWGLVSVFALAGFMGLTFGPSLDAYIQFFSNGGQLGMLAFGGAGAIFLGLIGYALISRKDFRFMFWVVVVGSLVLIVVLLLFLVALIGGVLIGVALIGVLSLVPVSVLESMVSVLEPVVSVLESMVSVLEPMVSVLEPMVSVLEPAVLIMFHLLLTSGLILSQTSEIIHSGETNYIILTTYWLMFLIIPHLFFDNLFDTLRPILA